MNPPTQPSATPRTDAEEQAQTQRFGGFMVKSDFARTLETELAEAKAECERKRDLLRDGHTILVAAKLLIAGKNAELARLRADCERACQTVAQMHAAAVGEVCGPRRGVIEDVADLRAEVERWQTVAAEMSAEREHNANEASRLRAEVINITQSRDKWAAASMANDACVVRFKARSERAEAALALKNSQCERAERAAAGALAERDALAKDKARLDTLNETLRDWIRRDGERENTCTYGILREVCNHCNCHRKKNAAKGTL